MTRKLKKFTLCSRLSRGYFAETTARRNFASFTIHRFEDKSLNEGEIDRPSKYFKNMATPTSVAYRLNETFIEATFWRLLRRTVH